MKQILYRLFEHQYLGREEARTILENIAAGKYNDSQIASLITVFLMRSISVEELTGFREALLEMRVPINLSEFKPIDIVGTGGDGKNTFNISTTSCFVVAGAGYNVHQSEIAIGSGGLQGKGFLNGTQTKLKFVPEQDTDFIFCTVGEEEGFVGAAGVLLLFLALILRLIKLAERQPYRFGRVYGYCVLGIFLFHVFINVGMVLGLTPVIGIPLPFFSYGGSSLWGFTLLLFIFLRIDAGRNMVRS